MPKKLYERAGGYDGGACMVTSLNACIPNLISISDLDGQIDNVHEEMKRETPNYLKEWCGFPGQSWHLRCIYKALCLKYSKSRVFWERLPNYKVQEKNQGKLFVYGILNYRMYQGDKSGNWNHSICLDTDRGLMFESNDPNWVKFDKKILSKIHAVYRIQILGPDFLWGKLDGWRLESRMDDDLESLDGLPSTDDDEPVNECVLPCKRLKCSESEF